MGFDLGVIRGLIDLKDTFTSTLVHAEEQLVHFSARVESEVKRTKDLSAGLETMGAAATRSGLALSVGLTAPIVAAGGVIAKLGIDAVESRNLMEVSFGSMINSADAWANALSKDLGLNRFEMEKTAGTMFNMVSSMGLGKQAAFDVSTGIVKLAADMASFRNIPIEDALTKLRSGLVGETEPLKAIGILVDENTVKHYAYANGIAQAGTELTAQQKVLARYGAILQQTSNDQGDLARTMESPANQLRIMQSRITETATALGTSLIPIVSSTIDILSRAVPWIQKGVELFISLPEPIKIGAIALAGLVAAAGPLLIIFGTLATSWAAMLPLINALGGPTLVLAKSMTLLGSSIAVIAVAFAAWEFGTWLGKVTGLTDGVEYLASKMMGLSDAQIEASRAARKSAEEHKAQEDAVTKTAKSTEDMVANLQKEIEAQQNVATSTNLAAEATKLAEKRAKDHAEALRQVNEKIASSMIMMNSFTVQQEALIVSYQKLGLSAGEIATKMGVSEEAVQRFLTVTQKSIEATMALWRQHYEYIATASGTAMEQQAAAIQRWFDDEVAKLDKSDKNYQKHYDALAQVAKDKLGEIGSEWDKLAEKSQEALQQQVDAAKRDYEKMLTSGLHFSREVLDEQLKKIKDLEDKLRGMGNSGKEAFDKMTDAANKNTTAMIKAAEEADKARKANQAMGGSFEVTRENFAATARGMGQDPGLIESLLKKGYSFAQAMLWAKHPDWPPPEHPGPRVQGFAEGGIVTVGEDGPERVALPYGSVVLPSRSEFAGGSGINIEHLEMHVNGTGEQVAADFKNRLMTTLKMRRKF